MEEYCAAGGVKMPELCRFQGIIIRMFTEQGERHHLPHFHVYYQGYVATYSIDPIEQLRGELPTRQRRLLEGWAELHHEELMHNWEQLQNHLPTIKIVPLR